MAGSDGAEAVIRAFVDAFARNDLAAMRDLLDDGFVGTITTADGGAREVTADDYVDAVRAMDVPTANLELALTDVTTVGEDGVLVMVEVHAARDGRTLHNFSGQLARAASGKLVSLTMVDAKPAESDRFWAS